MYVCTTGIVHTLNPALASCIARELPNNSSVGGSYCTCRRCNKPGFSISATLLALLRERGSWSSFDGWWSLKSARKCGSVPSLTEPAGRPEPHIIPGHDLHTHLLSLLLLFSRPESARSCRLESLCALC